MVDSPKDLDEGQNLPQSQTELEHSADTLPELRPDGSIRVDDLLLDRSDPGVPAIIASELATTPEGTQDPASDDSGPEEEEAKTAKDLISVQQRIPTQVTRAEKALQSGREIRILEQQLTSTNVYEPDLDPPTVLIDPTPKAKTPKSRFLLAAALLAVLLSLGVYSQTNKGSDALPLKIEAAGLTIKPPPKPRARTSIAVPPAAAPVGNDAPALAPVKQLSSDQAKPTRPRPAETKKRRQKKRRKLKTSKRGQSADTSATVAKDSARPATDNPPKSSVTAGVRADEKKTDKPEPTAPA